MNKFEQYRKAESVVKSVNRIGQLDAMTKYIKLFGRQVNDIELSHSLRKEGLKTIDRLQEKAGLSDLITLRSFIDKV